MAKAKQAVNITEQQKSVEVQELRAKITELTQVAEDIEKERDFYFHKVLDVEKICKDGAGNESKRVLAVLYAKNDEKESFGQEKENFSQEKKSSNGCFADENGDKGGFESTPKKAALSWEASIMAESGNECQEKGDSVVEKEAMAQEDAETMLL